jgi:hypothetical protein
MESEKKRGRLTVTSVTLEGGEGALRSRHARTIAARRLPIQGGALARRRAEFATLGLVPEQRPNRILLQVYRLAYTNWPLEIR